MSTITKKAYVTGIQDTLTETGLVTWPNQASYSDSIEKISGALTFDPYNQTPTLDSTKEVAQAVVKLSEYFMEEDEKEKEKDEKEKDEEYTKDMDKEEKEAALQYLNLRRTAYKKAELAKRATQAASQPKSTGPSTEGQELSDNPGNSHSEAAQHNSVARIDLENRPEGFAGGTPSDEPSAMLGREQKAASDFLASLFGKSAMPAASQPKSTGSSTEGQEIDDNPGNSHSEAAQHNSVARIDLENRPEGFAGGTPSDEPSAMLGKEQKEAAFEILFRKTAEEVIEYLPRSLKKESKITAIRAMMPMTEQEKIAYLKELNKTV